MPPQVINSEIAEPRCSSFAAAPLSASDYVCWSRMQTEAGQKLEAIIARKEIERRAGNGTFTWGVGNAPALIANRLARAGVHVPVVFSIMKSRPKVVDITPARTFVWRRYIDANGAERPLPRQALITSRGDSAGNVKRRHYALMCHSVVPLKLRRGSKSFHPKAYRNAGGTGAPIGASQVTAMLRRVDSGEGPSAYEENLSASLTDGYWVKLTDPVQLCGTRLRMLEMLDPHTDDASWLDFVDQIRSGPAASQVADRLLLI